MTDIPYGNVTALNHELVHGWEPSAKKRGTADILYSCLVTTTLCIYTAIHLNIPDPQETNRQKYLRLGKWILIGIFAPEWVIFAAWVQWNDARELLNCIKQNTVGTNSVTESDSEHHLSEVVIASEGEEAQASLNSVDTGVVEGSTLIKSGRYASCPQPEHHKDRHVADMAYAFYAVMGGIRVDVSDISDQIHSIVLPKLALMQLVSDGGYCHLQLDSKLIEDRSKANYVAKLLVCTQVIWMATQCIARKATGMPLTLLELHTFAHVLCALCIYAFWFKKPLGVNEATTIALPDQSRGKIAHAVCAHHEQAVQLSLPGRIDDQDSRDTTIHVSEQVILKAQPKADSDAQKSDRMVSAKLETCGSHCAGLVHLSEKSPRDDIFVYRDLDAVINEFEISHIPHHYHARVTVTLTDKVRLRWRLARSAKLDDSLASCWTLRKTHPSTRLTTYPNHTTPEDDPDGHMRLLSVVFGEVFIGIVGNNTVFFLALSITCAYGGIHLGAWYWTFPSAAELWLWRTSGIVIVGFMPTCMFAFISHVVLHYDPKQPPRPRRHTVFWLHALWSWPLAVVFSVLILLYPLTRIFLVVEVFLSLRTVPIGVYATVPWTQYIPHI